MASKRTRALQIPKAVKDAVWERDRHRCICCGSPYGLPEAHFIPRSQGGLGNERNIVTLCRECHRKYDQTTERETIKLFILGYLIEQYPDWQISQVKYRKP